MEPLLQYDLKGCQIMEETETAAGCLTNQQGSDWWSFPKIAPWHSTIICRCFSVDRTGHRIFVDSTNWLDWMQKTKELSSQSSEVVITIKVNFVRNCLPLHRFKYILGWSQPVHNLAITEMVLRMLGWELPKELLFFFGNRNATFRILLGGGWHLLFVQFLLESNSEGSDNCKANPH